MSSRTPSAERICDAAVLHFSERGYDAASLNEIAEAVGIRKASLYAHFAGKDALFMDVFADAVEAELTYVGRCFAQPTKVGAPGERYCATLAERYAGSVHLRFLLRTAYLPPAALRQAVSDGYQRYLDTLLEHFAEELRLGWTLSEADRDLYGQAYLGMVDSLHVELIYTGGTGFARRLAALRRLLTDSLGSAA